MKNKFKFFKETWQEDKFGFFMAFLCIVILLILLITDEQSFQFSIKTGVEVHSK